MNHCHWNFQTFFRSTNTKTYWYVGHILKNSIGSTICDPSTKSGLLPSRWNWDNPPIDLPDRICLHIYMNKYNQTLWQGDPPEPKQSRRSYCGMKRQAGSERKCRIWPGRNKGKWEQSDSEQVNCWGNDKWGTVSQSKSLCFQWTVWCENHGWRNQVGEREEFQGPAKWNLLLSTWSN